MLTTAGIAVLAASLNDAILRPGASTGLSAVVTTPAFGRAFHDSRSGRSVVTTNRMPRQIVVVWAKISQSLRIRCKKAAVRVNKSIGLKCALQSSIRHATRRVRDIETVSRRLFAIIAQISV